IMRRTLAMGLCLATALYAAQGWGAEKLEQRRAAARSKEASAVSGGTISGVPGSPDATMSIDGRQLPAPPAKFGGVIRDNAYQSKPYWPPRIVPPAGA